MKIKKTGTYEWVGKTFNIYDGCPYLCNYPCYARVLRLKKEEEWVKATFNEKWFKQKLKDYPMGFLANCMCFSAHDIYPENQENCLKFILRILNETNNTILITSKANIDTIKYLCENLEPYKKRISFMITITSLHESLAVKFEPNAPLICERLLCLEYLNYHDWLFNVSIEPFLDKNPIFLIERILKNYQKINSIWLGCNSRKHYEYHNIANLLFIMDEINKFPKSVRDIIHLKNSFIDKLPLYSLTKWI